MLKVNNNLCFGCGLCIQVCPQGAVSLVRGKAKIDTKGCNSCHRCLEICPPGAIFEMIIVYPKELRVTVSSLRQRADDIIGRIDRLVTKA